MLCHATFSRGHNNIHFLQITLNARKLHHWVENLRGGKNISIGNNPEKVQHIRHDMYRNCFLNTKFSCPAIF